MKRLNKTLLAAVIATTGVSLIAGCSNTPEAPRETSLKIGVPYIIGNYDPFNGGGRWGEFDMQGVYDALVDWDQSTDTYTPSLAAEWTIADDRLSMQVTIRDDVTFIDGTHLDAAGLEKYFDAYLSAEMVDTTQIGRAHV